LVSSQPDPPKATEGLAVLFMKKVYFDAIRSGGKTTTLRYWRSPRVRAGSVHTIRGLGRVRIDEIATVELANLTDADARIDGLEDIQTLRRRLRRLYPPQQRTGRKLYRIRFTFLPAEAPASD